MEEEISLFDLMNILLKRKWVIVSTIILATLVAALLWYLMPQTIKIEFPVFFKDSTLSEKLEGQVQVVYYGVKEPVNIPYAFVLQFEDTEDPTMFLSQLTKREKLREVAQEGGFLNLVESLGDVFSINIASQKDGGFLITISVQNRLFEEGKLLAERLHGFLRERLLLLLEERHSKKTRFFQNLFESASKHYKESQNKFLAFTRMKDVTAIDSKLQSIEETLNFFKDRQNFLRKQYNTPLLTLPLALESFQEFFPADFEKILSLQEELKKSYTKELQELEEKIVALEEEKRILQRMRWENEDIVREYNTLLRDYTFWKTIYDSLALFPRTSFPFDGQVKIGEIQYSRPPRNLKLNLAAGIVTGSFLGIFGAFFAEFWESARREGKGYQ